MGFEPLEHKTVTRPYQHEFKALTEDVVFKPYIYHKAHVSMYSHFLFFFQFTSRLYLNCLNGSLTRMC